MSTVVSLPEVSAAVMARLGTVSNATGFEGEAVNVPLIPGGDGRAKPYWVYRPGAGDPAVEPDLGDCAVELAWSMSLTCAAGTVEDLLHLVDRVNTALYRWIPTVAGYVCGPLRPPPGFRTSVQLDRSTTPHRPFMVLEFGSIITAT